MAPDGSRLVDLDLFEACRSRSITGTPNDRSNDVRSRSSFGVVRTSSNDVCKRSMQHSLFVCVKVSNVWRAAQLRQGIGSIKAPRIAYMEACALSRHATAPLPRASTQCGLGCAASCGGGAGSNTCFQHRFAARSALLPHGRFARCAPHPATCARLAQQYLPCRPHGINAIRPVEMAVGEDCGGLGRTSQAEPMKYYDYTRLYARH